MEETTRNTIRHFRSNVTRSRDVNGGSFNPTMTIYRLDFRFPACPRKLCGFSWRRDVIFSYTRVQIFVHERTRCTINIEGGKETRWRKRRKRRVARQSMLSRSFGTLARNTRVEGWFMTREHDGWKFSAINQMPRDSSFSIAADACYECFFSQGFSTSFDRLPEKVRNRNSLNSKEILFAVLSLNVGCQRHYLAFKPLSLFVFFHVHTN